MKSLVHKPVFPFPQTGSQKTSYSVQMFKESWFVSSNCFPERSSQLTTPSTPEVLSTQQQIKIITQSVNSHHIPGGTSWLRKPVWSRRASWVWRRDPRLPGLEHSGPSTEREVPRAHSHLEFLTPHASYQPIFVSGCRSQDPPQTLLAHMRLATLQHPHHTELV